MAQAAVMGSSFWLLPVLASGLTGCAGLSASPRSPISNHDAAIREFETVYAPARVAECIVTPLEGQTACRDRIAQALLVAIDLRYADFELGFFDANRYGSFGATVATLGLTGAASVSGGGAARILSAIAAGVTGTREAFNREVLIERTATALQSAMRAQRNTVLVQIREGLRQPATVYPLGAALSDVYAYFRAGTLPGALTGVNEAVATDARNARARLGKISATAVTPSAQNLFRQYQATPAAGQPAFLRKIEGIMQRLGLPGEADDDLFFSPEREADRQAILRELAPR